MHINNTLPVFACRRDTAHTYQTVVDTRVSCAKLNSSIIIVYAVMLTVCSGFFANVTDGNTTQTHELNVRNHPDRRTIPSNMLFSRTYKSHQIGAKWYQLLSIHRQRTSIPTI